MHVGQQLVDRLIGYGVRHVFGCPGGQTLPMYNGIFHRAGQIDHVLMRDERSGVFAADAYARATGRIGVCDATVGPGASNLVSGLVEAYSSSVPVLAIVSDIPREWEHRRSHGSASQAFEQRSFLEGCVKYYGRVQTPGNLPEILHACIRIATAGRPGPTVLEVPDDVFADDAMPEDFAPSPEVATYPRHRVGPDPTDVEKAVERLLASRMPMIVAGGGALHSGASDEISDLVDLLDCPIATTLTGKGIIAETHPMCVGVAGRFGVPMANSSLEEADCVVYIGCKTGQTTTLNWTLPYLDTPVVHIDVDPHEIDRNYHDTVAILADAKLGVAALAAGLRGGTSASKWDKAKIAGIRQAWWEGPIAFKEPAVPGVLKPQEMMRVFREVMSDDDLFVSDASLASGWIGGRWQVRNTGRHFFAPAGSPASGGDCQPRSASARPRPRPRRRPATASGSAEWCAWPATVDGDTRWPTWRRRFAASSPSWRSSSTTAAWPGSSTPPRTAIRGRSCRRDSPTSAMPMRQWRWARASRRSTTSETSRRR